MSQPVDQEYEDFKAKYEDFRAWRAARDSATPVAPEPDVPAPTIADVIKALVNVARFGEEATVRAYHEVIDAWHNATNPTVETGDNAS